MITAGTIKYTPTERFSQWVLASSVDTLKARYPSEYESWKAHAYHPQLADKLDESLKPFSEFLLALGPKPHHGMSLDQIDRTRPLVANNLRWASPEDQCSNKSNARLYVYLGCPVQLTLAALCRIVNKVPDTVRKQLNKGKPIGGIIPGAVECAPEPSSNYNQLFYASEKYPGKEGEYPWPTDRPGLFDRLEDQFRARTVGGYANTRVGRLEYLIDQLAKRSHSINRRLEGFHNDMAEMGEETWIQVTDPLERKKLEDEWDRLGFLYERALPKLEHAKKVEQAQRAKRKPSYQPDEYYDPGDSDPGDEDPRDWEYQEEPTPKAPAKPHSETFDDLPLHLQESFVRDVVNGTGPNPTF